MDNLQEPTLGQKLKNFRKRSGMSQMELENDINLAHGSVSRIEKGKINPTKETVITITDALKLNHRELDYLIGQTAQPATPEEIAKAQDEVEGYLSRKVIAYLIDERWRLFGISDYMKKMLNLDRNYIEGNLGTCTIEFITNPALGIVNRFSSKYMDSMLEHNLRYFYKEVGFMVDDPIIEKAVTSIRSTPQARVIWDGIVARKDENYSIREGRKLYFSVAGFDIPFIYVYEPVLVSSRFQIVECIPANKFVKLLTKLIP